MIRFDNGPPDGDYVRYIDALMKERAASLVAATMGPDTDRRSDPMSVAMTLPAFKSSLERSRDAKSGVALSTRPQASTVHSPSNGASALSPAAATAIASALMRRDELGTAPSVGTVVDALAIAAGVILILIGFLGPTSNVVLMVAGGALVSWAIKRFRARSVPPAAATVADVFTAMPTQRASSRAKIKDRP